MIRYFEVFGLNREIDYFGFMDTISDRIIELDGAQFFDSYQDFSDHLRASRLTKSQSDRLDVLIPEHIKRDREVGPVL